MKKKTIQRALSLLLAAFSVVGVAAGCKKKKKTSDERPVVKSEYTTGTHVYTATETNSVMVQNGASEYVVVIPADADETIYKAKDEFIWLFEKATNAKLRWRFDGDLTHSASEKYISIGETSLLASTGVDKEISRLGSDGHRIVTKDNSVYLWGGTPKGSLYSVYTFMSVTFGFEQYYKDCYEIQTDVTNLKLRDYDVTDIPDIAIRTDNYGLYSDTSEDYDENNFATRMMMGTHRSDPIMPVFVKYDDPNASSSDIHNCDAYLPESTYKEDHPSWYSTGGQKQLCYTARGDETELELMIEECAKKVENSLKIFTPDKYPQKNVITLTIEDTSGGCRCSACEAEIEKYTTPCGAVIKFMNRMAAKVDEWMQQPENAAYKREDFKIIFFAYNDLTYAPCKWNADTQSWDPIDESVRCADNVGVYLAPIQSIEFQLSVYDEINKRGRENIDAWASITDSVYFWTYSTNFNAIMYPYDSMNFFNSEGYQYLASKNTKYIFNQAQHIQHGTGTGWHNLKMYLDAKLSWNTTLDVDQLVDDYFNAMFKEAAPIMKSLYLDMRAYIAYINKTYNKYQVKSVYTGIDRVEYWPLNTCLSWLDKCEVAWEAIEKYKTTDPKLYEKLYYHIGAEYLFPSNHILKKLTTSVPSDRKAEIIKKYKDIVAVTGADNKSDNVQAYAASL